MCQFMHDIWTFWSSSFVFFLKKQSTFWAHELDERADTTSCGISVVKMKLKPAASQLAS